MWVGASLKWCVTYRFFFNILDCFLTLRVTTSSCWREGHGVYLPQEQRPDGVAFHIFSRSLLMLPAPHPVKPCLSFLRCFCKSLLWAHMGGPLTGDGVRGISRIPTRLPPAFVFNNLSKIIKTWLHCICPLAYMWEHCSKCFQKKSPQKHDDRQVIALLFKIWLPSPLSEPSALRLKKEVRLCIWKERTAFMCRWQACWYRNADAELVYMAVCNCENPGDILARSQDERHICTFISVVHGRKTIGK